MVQICLLVRPTADMALLHVHFTLGIMQAVFPVFYEDKVIRDLSYLSSLSNLSRVADSMVIAGLK